jgi:RimK family alpha-L-glutamate ligase
MEGGIKGMGIIYNSENGVDWAIRSFKEGFERKGISVALFDANSIENSAPVDSLQDCSFPEIEKLASQGYGVWMNRVYPSESSKETIDKSLTIVGWLGSRNYLTINPLTACASDYDKNFAFQLMDKYDVPTPKTKLLTDEDSLEGIVNEFEFPLIVKKNTGGKGIGVKKVNSEKELEDVLNSEGSFSGKYLVQEFAKPVKNYDVRIGVIDGEPLIAYARTLVDKGNQGISWMGSCNHGSKIIEYEPSDEEKRLAVLSTKAIGAKLNEVDIQITKDGPVIIENNPTPGYDEGEERWVELIIEHIYENHLKNEE